MIATALAELIALKQKYEILNELSSVFEAIDELAEERETKTRKVTTTPNAAKGVHASL